MKVRRASLSMGLEAALGVSDMTAPVIEVPEATGAAIGAATGFALAEMLDMPILPVSVSNNPPTDAEELTTSGSTISPEIISPMVCATINAHTL